MWPQATILWTIFIGAVVEERLVEFSYRLPDWLFNSFEKNSKHAERSEANSRALCTRKERFENVSQNWISKFLKPYGNFITVDISECD